MGKIVEVRNLYKDTISDLAKNEKTWINFLNCASWNFKYSFDDQILIYAQRPDATACAEMKEWNEKVRRWVNKNSKVIFVNSKENSRYPYRMVFDVSDTHNYKNTPYKLWEVKEEFENAIIETLEGAFGEIDTKDNLAQAISLSSYNIVMDNIQDYLLSIQKHKKGSKLENMSDEEIEAIFMETLWASVSYMLMKRCNINPEKEFNKSEFSFVSNFNNENLISILGTATSDIAEMGLREIAKTVIHLQNEEKNRNRTFARNNNIDYYNVDNSIKGGDNNVKYRVQETRRLYDTKYNLRGGENTNRQIRTDEIELSKGTSKSRVYNSLERQEVSTTFNGNTRNSDKYDNSNSTTNGKARWGNRGNEDERPDEMDRSNEQLQDDSRRTSNEGVNLYLELPTEEEQKQNIAEAENASAFSFTQEMIDNVLVTGSGFVDGKFRIYEQLNKSLSSEENVEFLKHEYGTGGTSASEDDVSEWHDRTGITLTLGYEDNAPKLKLTWKKVEKRIRELISLDRYFSEKQKDEYIDWLDANGILNNNNHENNVKDEDYKLAEKLNNFIKDYDLNSYMNNVLTENTETDNIELILADINDSENIKEYINFLKSILEDSNSDDEFTKETKNLIAELENKLPNYEFIIGDVVYIGIDEYEIRAINNEKVTLVDIKFPIMTKEMPREVFENRVKENSANDRLRTNIRETTKKNIIRTNIVENNEFSYEKRKEELASFIGTQIKDNENSYKIVGFEQEIDIYDAKDMTDDKADSLDLFNLQNIKTEEYTIEPVGYVKHLINEETKKEKTLEERLHKFLNEYDIYDVDEVSLDEVKNTLNDKQKILDTVNYFYEILNSEDMLDEFNTELSDFIKELSDLYEAKDKEQIEISPELQEEKIKVNVKKKRRNKIEYFDLHPEISLKDRNNYSIENNDLGVGTPREKYVRNIEAIKILKQCESENRYATVQEQEILANYVGWGGLSEVFDINNSSWSKEYEELKSLLTEKEYNEARQSTLTAFYTPPIVIKSIYKALENMGLEKGNILEPSCRSRKFYWNDAR